ncbi:MAG TPA: tetratricopeptide repeat protein [Pyrinomonadaceae bacterium]
MRTKLALLFILLISGSSVAQHHEAGAAATKGPVDLGKIEFPTSGPVEAQKSFIEGVLLLHSFEYARARRAFQEASRIAPDFAMAYWGEAMTHDHRIWGEQDRSAALAALARLAPTPAERRAKAPTEREKMYFDAVEKLLEDGDEKQIASSYSNAMAALTKRFPDDLEAQAFYSLSILGLTGTVRNTDNYLKAAAVAEAIYKKNPRHPGALHYLIHAYDDPEHARLGLTAARAYGTVARSASHAQHMPSHIFFALGMWEESIAANTASMKTARDEGAGGYHPLHWLVHAYLQLGRDDEAAKLIAIVEDDMTLKPSAYARTHLAMTRATYLVEARGVGPESLMQPVAYDEMVYSAAFANHDLAVALEHVRKKDLSAAGQTLDSVRARNAAMKAAVSSGISAERYRSVSQGEVDTIAVIESMLAAAIQFASGEKEKGLTAIIAAAKAEDGLVFEYGPPAIVKPAWEQAGEMFLAAGKKREAADAFRRVLKRYPNRKLSNEGLKAATSAGNDRRS